VLSSLSVAVIALAVSASPARTPGAQKAAPAATSPTRAPAAAPAPAAPPPAATPAPAPAPAGAAAAKPAPAKVKVAVMDVVGVQGVAPGTATILTNIVVADVARAGLDTISKGDITAIIGFEKQRQILGCSGDASCVAEIGGALGVDFMLTGQVGQIGSQYHLSLQLVETKKARVAARASRFSDKSEDALVKVTRDATTEVLAPAVARLPLASLRAASAPGPAAKAGPSHRSAWIAYGLAGALLVGGGATGYVAKSRYDDLEAKRGTPGYATAYASDRRSIRTTALAADVMLGGAVVAAGVGTWLWFRADRAAPVAVVPVVAPGGASLTVAAAF
jgi:TolB-like protein